MWPTAEPDLFERDETLRTDSARMHALWADPARRLIAVSRGQVDLHPSGDFDVADAILLGVADAPWFAVRERTDKSADLRMLVDDMTPVERSAALTAAALDNWHGTHKRCPRCGEHTRIARAGWMRVCDADGSEHFPRTDPAIIVLVVDDDGRALLGRRAVWPEGWFSTLAGFVEPGETFEQAVVREVAEEAGVDLDVTRVEYRATQPWPFPSSLMIAFTAHTNTQPTTPDGDEIVETRWFSRDEFEAAAQAGEVRIPPRISVAHHLIVDWFGQPVPHIWTR